ncbi:MAG: hypothetical protein EBX50_12425 [Chitinophagia bacterium]|nr:hypothetical protein [Chitinophagia bacterium]
MKIHLFSADYNGKIYRIHKRFGFLLEYTTHVKSKVELTPKIKIFLHQVHNPYLLKPFCEFPNNNIIPKPPFYTKILAKVLTFFCLRSFLFVRLLSNFRFPIFDSTAQAVLYFRKLYPKEQNNLCLPRSLFAACTSKTFKDEGALFIGVFLPSRAMHAWILENGKQPDYYDDIWICYQPVAVIY